MRTFLLVEPLAPISRTVRTNVGLEARSLYERYSEQHLGLQATSQPLTETDFDPVSND